MNSNPTLSHAFMRCAALFFVTAWFSQSIAAFLITSGCVLAMYFGPVDGREPLAAGEIGYVFLVWYFLVLTTIADMSGMPQDSPGAALPSSKADIEPTTAKAFSHASSI